MKSYNTKALLISVPLYRLLRIFLLASLIGEFKSRGYDIYIISPFIVNERLLKIYGLSKESNLVFKKRKFSGVAHKMYILSELLRTYGFWRRNAHKGLKYYLSNSFNSKPGNPTIFSSFFRKILIYIIQNVGTFNFSWKFIDKIFCYFFMKEQQEFVVLSKYSKIKIIQSANWGFQDRYLAWLSTKFLWTRIFVPYTTDQLYCNGYLINDYDLICPQGPVENFWSKDLFKINKNKILCLGSLWFRQIDEQITKQHLRANSKISTVLIAGAINEFFPKNSDLKHIDFVCEILFSLGFHKTKVIYRTFKDTPYIQDLKLKCQKYKNLEIAFSDPLNYGLDRDYNNSDFKKLSSDLNKLQSVDLIIVVGASSLFLEASYLDVPSISSYIDSTGFLKNKNTKLILNKNSKNYGFNSIPVVNTEKQLRNLISNFIMNKKTFTSIPKKTVKDWDYGRDIFHKNIKRLADF
jgi:hypothetical protein